MRQKLALILGSLLPGLAMSDVPVRSSPQLVIFKVGDRVVLPPTAVMEISGIGPRSSFVKKGYEHVVPTFGVQGGSIFKEVKPDETAVYALRFPGEKEPFLFLQVAEAAASRPPLRHSLRKPEAEVLLSRLSAVKDSVPPLGSAWELALNDSNDPWAHLLLLRKLVAHEQTAGFTDDHRRLLERETSFIVDEFSRALAVEPEAFERVLRTRLMKTMNR